MKNISLLLVAITLLLISCTRDPLADFTISNSNVGIGEIVYFTNRSIDAESFEWDFGDGYRSSNFNTSHFYDIDGVYNVSLKAFSHDRVDVAYMTVNVIDASLEITVEEYYEPYYLVSDISVILYASINDWENPDTSPKVVEGFTDVNGVVRFDHLAAQRYYVDVWGPNHDNYQLAAEDVGFIETPVLILGTLTKFTALVDYYPDGKKSALSRFDIKAQRKIEAAEHAPRKKTEK
jgi:PKD repeat protein